MNFQKSPRVHRISRHLRPFTERHPREGSSSDRGQVIRYPALDTGLPRFLERYANQSTFLRRVLPGMVTGAADVDPALVLTATAVSVAFGYQLLWVVLLAVPFLLMVFSVSARIGFETRRGLVDLLRDHYGQRVALGFTTVLAGINMLMLVADLLAVTDALSLVLGQRRIFFVAMVAFGVWNILISGNYQQITRSLALLSLPLFVYVLAALTARAPVGQLVSHSVIPMMHADVSYTKAVIAIFGALLTPYLLVWQTSSRRDTAVSGAEVHESEHRIGTIVTTILCFCVMIVAATALRSPTGLDVPLTVRLTAEALTPAFGELGPVIFAIGIIGAGMVALPVITASLCYSVSEAMGWDYGLNSNPWEAKRFYLLISIAMLIAAAFNFFHLDTINVVYTSQVAAGVLAIPILIFILLLSNDRRVMKTVNSRIQNFWIGAAAGALAATALLFVYARLRS